MKTIPVFLSGILLLTSFTIFISSCDDSGVIPLDNTMWTKIYGGTNSDVATVILTSPNGYLAAGSTNSYGAGGDDAFAMKFNNEGNVDWMKTYGGGGLDEITSAISTSDGGYLLAGTTTSFGAIQFDVFVLKLDANGERIWAKCYKMQGNDHAVSVKQTDDGGFVISGYTDSYGAGYNDILLMRIDSFGSVTFIKVFGGAWNDVSMALVYSPQTGMTIAGSTFSDGNFGDFVVINTYGDGVVNWIKTYGGEGYDEAHDIQFTNDGPGISGIIISGYTQSFGLVTGDAYFIKTDINGVPYWSKTIGGTGMDQSMKVRQTADGGYISTGFTNSFGGGLNDILNIRLFGDGAYSWAKVYGGPNREMGNSIIELENNNLMCAGITETTTDIYDLIINMYKHDGSACGNNSAIIPTGGDPVTVVGSALNIAANDITAYETIDAAVVLNSITPGSTLICKNP